MDPIKRFEEMVDQAKQEVPPISPVTASVMSAIYDTENQYSTDRIYYWFAAVSGVAAAVTVGALVFLLYSAHSSIADLLPVLEITPI